MKRLTVALVVVLSAFPIFRGTPPLEWQCWQTHGQVHKASQVWHCFTARHPQRGQ